MGKSQGFLRSLYAFLLVAPGGFVVLGLILGISVLKSRDIKTIRSEILHLFDLER